MLPRLERLDLGGCGLADAGSLPAELWRCPALRSLELSGNALTRVPEDVRHLTALESLGLADNRLDALPGPALSVLPRLNTLSLHGNPALVAASPSLQAALHGSLASSVRAPDLLGAWLSDRPEESMAHAAMLRRLRVRAEEKSAGGNAAEEEKEKKSAGGEARESGGHGRAGAGPRRVRARARAPLCGEPRTGRVPPGALAEAQRAHCGTLGDRRAPPPSPLGPRREPPRRARRARRARHSRAAPRAGPLRQPPRGGAEDSRDQAPPLLQVLELSGNELRGLPADLALCHSATLVQLGVEGNPFEGEELRRARWDTPALLCIALLAGSKK